MIGSRAARDLACSDAIGRTSISRQLLAPASLARLVAALGGDPAESALAPLWHWAFFHDLVPESGLGEDGHRRRGTFLPDIPGLPRRMFAATTIEFLAPPALGEAASLTSCIVGLQHKTGREGELVFADVERVVEQGGRPCVREVQTVVYRAAATPPAPALPRPAADAEQASPGGELWWPSTVTLFRFSAATFNSHRIHYDRAYAMEIEGYPDLVVHGPLIAARLARLAAQRGALARIAYRASAPAFVDQPLRLVEDAQGSLRAIRCDGVVVASMKVTYA